MDHIIFKEWSDSVRQALMHYLLQTDFLIRRGRAIYDVSPRRMQYLWRFGGDVNTIVDALEKWVAEIQQVCRRALERFPDQYRDYRYKFSFFGQEDPREERWRLSSVLIDAYLERMDPNDEELDLAVNSRIVRTGKARFLLFVRPPEQAWQRIVEDALWHSRMTAEDVIFMSTLNRVGPDGVVACPYPECEGELLPTRYMPPSQAAMTLQGTPEQRYNLFFHDAVADEGFWGLWHPFLGWWWEQEGEERVLPLWCDWQLAEEGFLPSRPDLVGYEARFIQRGEWERFFLPVLRAGGWRIEVMRGVDRRVSIPGPWVSVLEAAEKELLG